MKNNIIYLSLGSNLGNKKAYLQNALGELKKCRIKILKTSSIYKTEPIGFKDQPEFFNIVIKGETGLSPDELLQTILNIEKKMVRKREKKWGPRIIDIDILLFNDFIIKKKDLIIPHPYMHKRNFVLIPLLEIAPDIIFPQFKKNILEFIKNNSGKVEKTVEKSVDKFLDKT